MLLLIRILYLEYWHFFVDSKLDSSTCKTTGGRRKHQVHSFRHRERPSKYKQSRRKHKQRNKRDSIFSFLSYFSIPLVATALVIGIKLLLCIVKRKTGTIFQEFHDFFFLCSIFDIDLKWVMVKELDLNINSHWAETEGCTELFQLIRNLDSLCNNKYLGKNQLIADILY